MNVKGPVILAPYICNLNQILTQDIREDADSFYLLVKKGLLGQNRQ